MQWVDILWGASASGVYYAAAHGPGARRGALALNLLIALLARAAQGRGSQSTISL